VDGDRKDLDGEGDEDLEGKLFFFPKAPTIEKDFNDNK
jgi:hypothetical protein